MLSRRWVVGAMLGLSLAVFGSGTVLAQGVGTVVNSPNTREAECRVNRNSERCICWNVNVSNTEWVMAEAVVYRKKDELGVEGPARGLAQLGTPLRYLYLRGYTEGLVFLPAQYADENDTFQGEPIDTRGVDPIARSTALPEANPSWLRFRFRLADGTDVGPPWDDVVRPGWKVSKNLLYNEDYKRDCAFTYLEEDLRRMWQIAGLVVGALLSITVAWAGVVHMQETASGNSYARTRTILARAFVGAIIVGGCYIIVDAINVELFGVADFWWTHEGALYDGLIHASP